MQRLVYECDLCHKEVKRANELFKTSLPCTSKYTIRVKDFECCSDCILKIGKILSSELDITEDWDKKGSWK